MILKVMVYVVSLHLRIIYLLHITMATWCNRRDKNTNHKCRPCGCTCSTRATSPSNLGPLHYASQLTTHPEYLS